MKNLLINSALAITLLAMSPVALAECELPAAPIIPDGNVASQDELIAAQKAMKAYQAELQDYRVCIDDMQETIDPEDETMAEKTAELNGLYDASVDAEDTVANEFNTAVRAFKARQ